MKPSTLCVTTVAFICLLTSAVAAGAPNRNWAPSGSQGALKDCVDLNSVVKRPDGYTQYDEMLLCDLSAPSENAVYVQAVRCDEDMSGATFAMKTRPLIPLHPSKDGAVHWADIPDEKSDSMVGQSAKFVCKRAADHR